MKIAHILAASSTLIAISLAPCMAWAADTLYIGGPGGSTQEAVEKKLVPAFES